MPCASSPAQHSGDTLLEKEEVPARLDLVCVGERPLDAFIPSVALRLEDRAMIHLAPIDMKRYRGGIAARVPQDVVLEWRDQATGVSNTGLNFLNLLEAVQLGLPLSEVVTFDCHRTNCDALDAPDARVIVQGRALSGAPCHHNRREPPFWTTIEEATSIVVWNRADQPLGELHVTAAEQFSQRTANGGSQGVDVWLLGSIAEALD